MTMQNTKLKYIQGSERTLGPDLVEAMLLGQGYYQWWDWDFDDSDFTLVGTGAETHANRSGRLVSGGTAGGSAAASPKSTNSHMLWSREQTANRLDWTKRVIIVAVVEGDSASTNGIVRIKFGATSREAGPLARKGIGFRISNRVAAGTAHDGSTEDVVDLNFSLVEDKTHILIAVSDGSGNVDFYIDGVHRGTSTGGPDALGTSGEVFPEIDILNGVDDSQNRLYFSLFRIGVQQ